MEYVADTVAIIRALSLAEGKIGKEALAKFNEADSGYSTIYVPTIVLMELMLLGEKKRISKTFQEILQAINEHQNFKTCELTAYIVEIAAGLRIREAHDRMIAATAKFLGLPLITCDEDITSSGAVKTIW